MNRPANDVLSVLSCQPVLKNISFVRKEKSPIFIKDRRTYPVDFLYKMPLLFNYTLSLYTRIDL